MCIYTIHFALCFLCCSSPNLHQRTIAMCLAPMGPFIIAPIYTNLHQRTIFVSHVLSPHELSPILSREHFWAKALYTYVYIFCECIVFHFELSVLGLSQLFENNFGNNRCLLEYENYSSLIGLQTSQRSIRSRVPNYRSPVDLHVLSWQSWLQVQVQAL